MAPLIRANSLYTIVNGPSWTQAEANSVKLGGHLVTISNAEEYNWILNTYSAYQNLNTDWWYKTAVWIGLTDSKQEGIWHWVSNEPSSWVPTWAAGMPDQFAGNPENYASLYLAETQHWRPWLKGELNDLMDSWNNLQGIAEIPLTSSITFSTTPKEGAGIFTTSINLSAGTTSSGNLAEGAKVYWKVTGIDADDLASGELSGSGTITNGKLDLEHSLKSDSDTGESFEVSVFSDAEMTQQIGSTRTASVEEANSIDTLPPILEELWFTHRTDENGNLLYTAHARVKDDQSGVNTGWNTSHIRVSSPSGIHQLYVTLDRFESGDNLNGVLAGDFTINRFQESGQWTVLSSRFQDSPKITDNAGNENKYNADKLAAQGISSNFLVNTPNPDITPPTLEDLWFTKTTDEEGNFLFTAHAKVKDDISGVTRTWAMTHLRLSSPTGKDKIYVVLDQLESGTPQDGIVSGTFTISKSQELGNWSIDSPEFNDSPRISDIAGNSTDYNAAKLLALGISPTFFVGYEDSSIPVPPTLQSTTATNNQLILTFSEDLQVAGGGALDTSLLTVTVDGQKRRITRAQINPDNASEVLVTVSGRSLIYASSLDISYNTSTAPESKGALVSANGIAVEAIAPLAVDTYTTTSNISTRGISNNYNNLILAGSARLGYGNTQDNILTGNGGNNTLDGLGGADTMLGGTGDDTYVVDNAADVVTELADDGTDTVQSSNTYTLGEHLENLTLIGKGNIDGNGNSGNNRITGNDGANILNGNGGTDILVGGRGNDTYVVDSVDDAINENGWSFDIDSVISSISWSLGINLENLTLSGSDAISGTGNNKDNIIIGNDAANILDGGNGGKDILTGAGGSDIFAFSSRPQRFRSDQADHITDFSSTEGDKIQITKRALGITASTVSLGIANGAADVNRALSTSSLFVYDTSNGELHWNQNGTRRGAGTGGVFAVLDNRATLSSGDFTLI